MLSQLPGGQLMHRGFSIALAIGGAVIAMNCGGGGGPATSPTPSGGGGTNATVTITITGKGSTQAFSPNPATVSAGQLVVFKNNDVVAHHVILDDGTVQTPDIAPGATSAPVAMGTNGSKTYHCLIHPEMVGGFNGSQGDPPSDCHSAYCLGGGD
jgi:plastocyanin